MFYDNAKSLKLMKRGGIIFVGLIVSCKLTSTHEPRSYSGPLGGRFFIDTAITDYHSCLQVDFLTYIMGTVYRLLVENQTIYTLSRNLFSMG